MVLVQHLAGLVEVEVVFAVFVPRQVHKQLQVVELYGVVGGHRVGALQFLQLLLEDFCRLLVPFLFRAALLEGEVILLGRGAAQLLLDGLHLLVEEVLTLLAVEFVLGLVLNLVLEFHQLEVAVQELEHGLGAVHDVVHLQDGLLVFHRGGEVGGQEVDEVRVAFDVLEGEGRLAGHIGRELHHLGGGVAQGGYQGLEVLVARDGRVVLVGLEGLGNALVVGLRLGDPLQHETFDALHDDGHAAVGHRDVLDDARHRAHTVQVGDRGFLHVIVALRDDADGCVGAGVVLRQLDGFGASHVDGYHHPRKQKRVSQRKKGYLVGDRYLAEVLLVVDGE